LDAKLRRLSAKNPHTDDEKPPDKPLDAPAASDLTPPARAVAAAYDLKREGKPVSLRAACERAGVDRGNLRKRYPEAIATIEAMSHADRDLRSGLRDRRTGNIDAVDTDFDE
jgi:hypothetical protein